MIQAPPFLSKLTYTTVGAKQHGDNARWQYVWDHISEIISQDEATALVERTVTEVKAMTVGKRVAWAWSGGKDSQALRVVMERCGIDRCVLAMTHDLEYPQQLRWMGDDLPGGADVISTGQDMDWLCSHLHLLFPQNSATAGEWMAGVQHKAQNQFFRRYSLDYLILGRRTADRNFVGPNGIYTAHGVTRYSPIRSWSHEEVLAVCYYYQMGLAPCYSWHKGWVVGTGPWPFRQWTGSTENGWREVYAIDPNIVIEASRRIASAATFLENL